MRIYKGESNFMRSDQSSKLTDQKYNKLEEELHIWCQNVFINLFDPQKYLYLFQKCISGIPDQ